MSGDKVEIEPGRKEWHPTPMFEQLVLVTTVDEKGNANTAPKSSVCVVALKRPMLGFACARKHRTARNILATGEFVVNVITAAQAPVCWKMGEYKDPLCRDMRMFGFTPAPARKVRPPWVLEARAHIECVLESHKDIDREVWFFADVVSVSMDREAFRGSDSERYMFLDLPIFLERRLYSSPGGVRHAPTPEGE